MVGLRTDLLSDEQYLCVYYAAHGLLNDEIAKKLDVGKAMITWHFKQCCKKLNLKNYREVIKYFWVGGMNYRVKNADILKDDFGFGTYRWL